MSTGMFKGVYFGAMVVETVIRMPYRKRNRTNVIVNDRFDREELLLLLTLLFGMFIFPLLYSVTPWLNFANYRLPKWASWLGVPIMGAALWIFWRAHVDLGRNWSPTLQIREEHTLVTKGIYGSIRHPMYASQWLWSIAQALLLQNWIAGFTGILLFMPLYFLRVPREERMMLEYFGEQYQRYMQETGRVVPRLRG